MSRPDTTGRTFFNPADLVLTPGALFGPPTALVNWCEKDYDIVLWCAELWNTVSNAAWFLVSFYGTYCAMREQLPKRIVFACSLGALIGLGSAAFHATLLYEWQLLDELPMMWGVASLAYIVFDLSPIGTPASSTQWLLPALLLVFNVVFTLSYWYYPIPIIFQLSFALSLIATLLRARWILTTHLKSTAEDRARNTHARQLLYHGIFSFLGAFALWGIDNALCAQLCSIRRAIGPLGFLLQLHSWWHLATAYGTYYFTLSMAYIHLCGRGKPENYEIGSAYGLPLLQRSKKGWAALHRLKAN